MAYIFVPRLHLEVQVAAVEFGQILTQQAVLALFVAQVWVYHCPRQEWLVSQLHLYQRQRKANQQGQMPEEARVVDETCLVGRRAYLEGAYQVGEASCLEGASETQAVEV